MEEDFKIIKESNGLYLLQFRGHNLMKEENPIIWSIVDEVCMEFASEQFARNEIRSIKRYITQNYKGDFEKWYNKEIYKKYNVKDKVISIEDSEGNTLMSLELDEKGRIVNVQNCDIADTDEDTIFNSGKELYRIQMIDEI